MERGMFQWKKLRTDCDIGSVTLATCNINAEHTSVQLGVGILTATRNDMGLALASIIVVSLHGTIIDLNFAGES